MLPAVYSVSKRQGNIASDFIIENNTKEEDSVNTLATMSDTHSFTDAFPYRKPWSHTDIFVSSCGIYLITPRVPPASP